ncbi:hypothetical protein HKX48_004467 [Thoreauomyces humboldtii]|nr:hypothetical protein HKX48_004467 [Thoreauomyces humboldtii]
MNELLPHDGIDALAAYADKHELFDLFESITARMVIEKPDDAIQFMIEQLQKPETPAIIMIGPPTAGQGPISEQLALHLDAVQICTGRLLATAIERQTSLGSQARPYLERGDYVPDNIMLGLVTARLQDPEIALRGYVLEGFPRTKQQATSLIARGYLPSRVIVIEVPDETIVQRQTQLRIDPLTNRLYDSEPDNPTVRARLIQRHADTEPAVRSRLAQFRRHVTGVLSVFDKTKVRRIAFPKGVPDPPEEAVRTVVGEVTRGRVSRAPRMLKAVVAGLPGSGRTTVADMIAREFDVVSVSPRSVLLEQLSIGALDNSDIAAHINAPENAPDTQIVPLIVARLKRDDCTSRGWVLDGFPTTRAQADLLREKGILPNRMLVLRASPETCQDRLQKRRRASGASAAEDEEIERRVQGGAKFRTELQQAYARPRAVSRQGRGDVARACVSVIQEIEADDAVEGAEMVLDRIRAAMIRGGNASFSVKA